MASSALVAGSILLLPAYLRARWEEDKQINAAAELGKSKIEQGTEAIENEMLTDSTAIAVLDKSLKDERPSVLVERVASLRENIRLTSFSYSGLSTTTAELTVQGVAPTRDSLLSFKSRVESMANNVRADLPISELAKGADIPFSMQIICSIP
jgi:hypothetical protein